MKATLDLDEKVLRRAKACAARDGVSLASFVEDALRARLASASSTREAERPFQLRLETVTGGSPPKIDISDRDALYDAIDRA